MTDAEIDALFDSMRDEIGVWADRREYFHAGWLASRKQALEDAAQTCDANAVAYGAMGATRMKEAARACAVVIRSHAEKGT